MEYFTSNDGVKLAYEVQGEGKPLLLLSGYAVPVGTMESLAEKLRPAGYQTILAEQRGIGASETLHYGGAPFQARKGFKRTDRPFGFKGCCLYRTLHGSIGYFCLLFSVWR